jgi:hypothetical protein
LLSMPSLAAVSLPVNSDKVKCGVILESY